LSTSSIYSNSDT